MAKIKMTHPRQRAVFGIIAIILIVIFTNWLIRSSSFGSRSIDLTEDKRYTLTEGTKAILGELETPVIIRYYATRDSKTMPQRVRNYIRTVDDLLDRYQKLANGMIRIELLDPQPDTDAEDSANLDGISGQRINEENLYFGLSISCLDQQTTIPFLDPNDETMLEYNLSSAIANVSNFAKTKVGLMTTLPIMGSPAQQPGQQPQQPWVIYSYLNQLYDLHYVSGNVKELDPEDIPVLLLIHPAELTSQTEYMIDQYVLKGGIVVACLDSYALTAPGGNPMMPGMGGVSKFSNLPSLLETWGIGFDANSVIADGKYGTDFGNNQRLHSHLSLAKDSITSDDEILTRGFENLYFVLAGGFTIKGGSGVSIETLVRTSKEVVLVPGQTATRPDPGLFAREITSGKHYGLVMRLKGKFKTAFPEGDPSQAQKKDEKKETTEEKEIESLKKGIKEGIVYLIADADFLFDQAAFQRTNQGYIPINNNAGLLQNILDQSTGSRHLIGARSRAAKSRPFTVIQEMETDFQQEIRDDVKKAEKKMQSIVTELQKLQSQKTQSKALVLSPEQEQKIVELQTQQISLRRELREKQKGLKTRKDQLFSRLTWMTVGITPSVIALVGIGVWIFRRRTTRAQ